MDHLKPMEKETICSHGAIFFRHHFFPFSADRNFLPLVAEHRGEDPGSCGGAARRGGVLPPPVSRNERCYAEEKKRNRVVAAAAMRARSHPLRLAACARWSVKKMLKRCRSLKIQPGGGRKTWKLPRNMDGHERRLERKREGWRQRQDWRMQCCHNRRHCTKSVASC